jgi:5-methylcytosine-specific restriction endonuclease McrA
LDCRASQSAKKRSLTLKETHDRFSVKGKHRSWVNSNVRNLCRSWNSSLQKQPCQKCGYSLHVEFCHIQPITAFPEETELAVINDPSNIIVLCRNCHWEFDHGLLKLDEIQPRALQGTN